MVSAGGDNNTPPPSRANSERPLSRGGWGARGGTHRSIPREPGHHLLTRTDWLMSRQYTCRAFLCYGQNLRTMDKI